MTANVTGLKELQAFLDQLPAKVEANIMRAALRQGANVVLQEAKNQVSVKEGYLRDSLRVSTRSRRGTVTATVKSSLYYAKWIEYGTAAHLIKVQDEERPTRMTRTGLKKFNLRTINKMINRGSLVIGGQFVGPVVSHPGATPKPFMRPALESQSQAALLAVGEAIKKRLNKQGLDASGVDLEPSE